MSQRFSLYEALTVDQNIAFFGGVYGLEGDRLAARRAMVLEMAGLQGRENTLAGDLSGGWRQRLALGCAILHEPSIVFLDEPTGGVDPLSRRRFWRLIDDLSRAGVAVLVTTHYLDEAEHCHRVAIIQAGKLAALGTVDELKSIFASRPIFELRSSRPVDAMQALDRDARGREDQHLRHRGARGDALARDVSTPTALAGRLRAQGIEVTACHPRGAVARRRVPRRGGERRGGVTFLGRVLAVTRKELRQISRDKRTLLILLFVPAFFLFVYGYALNFDIRNIALAVEDNDQSVQSRQLVSAFVRSGYFDLVAAVQDDEEVVRLLDTGDARAVLVIPARFGARASTGRARAPCRC